MNALTAAISEASSAVHGGAAYRLALQLSSGVNLIGVVVDDSDPDHILFRVDEEDTEIVVYIERSSVILARIGWLP